METSQGASPSQLIHELTPNENGAVRYNSNTSTSTNSNRKKKRKQLGLKMLRRTALAIAALACASSIDSAESFAGFSAPLHQTTTSVAQQQLPHQRAEGNNNSNWQRRNARGTALKYAPSNHPTTKTAPMVAQAFYSSYKTNRNPTKPRNHQNGAPLSNSVLSSSDTLPSFPTAHGLLSPETVMRMEIMTSRATRSEAVENFLRTYRRDGPMACLPMLSDSKVLPVLTQAMRDIIQ